MPMCTPMHTHKLVQTSMVTVFFYLHFSIWWFGLVLGPPCPPTHSIIEQSRRRWNLDVTLSKSETGWKRSCARAGLLRGLWMQSNYRQCSSALISHPVCSLPVGYLEESQLIFFFLLALRSADLPELLVSLISWHSKLFFVCTHFWSYQETQTYCLWARLGS